MSKSELREAYFKLFKDGTEEEFEHYYNIIVSQTNKIYLVKWN